MFLDLLILDGPQAGRRLPVGSVPVTFGRSASAAVSFPQDNFISGTHLSVQADTNGVLLTDLRSTNGTFLNGQRITQAVAVPGDIIRIGSLSLQVQPASAAPAQPPVPLAPPAQVPQPAAAPVSPSPFPSPPVLSAPASAGAAYGNVQASVTTTIPAFQLPPMQIPEPPPFAPAAQMPAAASPASSADVDFFSLLEAAVPSNDVPAANVPAPEKTKPRPVLQVLQEVPAPLFCLLNAGADEMARVVLGMANLDLWQHCLIEGDHSGPPPTWAPYLLPLPQDSPLLRLLAEKGWGKAWGSYFTSSAPFEDLQQHFRKFLAVQLQQKGEVYFRFYDPRVLREFLLAAAPNELTMFFGPVEEWLLESDNSAAMLRAHNSPSGLLTETMPVSAALPSRTLREV